MVSGLKLQAGELYHIKHSKTPETSLFQEGMGLCTREEKFWSSRDEGCFGEDGALFGDFLVTDLHLETELVLRGVLRC